MAKTRSFASERADSWEPVSVVINRKGDPDRGLLRVPTFTKQANPNHPEHRGQKSKLKLKGRFLLTGQSWPLT